MDWQEGIKQLQEMGPVWVGKDMELEKKEIIQPRQLQDISLIISKENLPPVEISRGVLNSLNYSVRSFIAQSGVDPIFHAYDIPDEKIEELKAGKEIAIPLKVLNYGQRAVEIEGGFMRFFWADDAKRLRGENLRNAVGTDFIAEGTEGKDWAFGGADLDEDMEYIKETASPESLENLCIKLPLTDKKYYIPADDEPVNIKSRRELPSVLKEIPEDVDVDFKIGETTKVKLSPDVMAVINTGGYDKGGHHIHSPLIDPGFEGYIRTEIQHDLNYIELFLYRR